jgi:hypothetical protein
MQLLLIVFSFYYPLLGNDAFFGVGVDGKINETIKYRVEFERVKTGDFDNTKTIKASIQSI